MWSFAICIGTAPAGLDSDALRAARRAARRALAAVTPGRKPGASSAASCRALAAATWPAVVARAWSWTSPVCKRVVDDVRQMGGGMKGHAGVADLLLRLCALCGPLPVQRNHAGLRRLDELVQVRDLDSERHVAAGNDFSNTSGWGLRNLIRPVQVQKRVCRGCICK